MKETIAILVVDDNPSMTQTLADIMSIKGFEVYAAYSGLEALSILQYHLIDVMLTDVVMPDMNGVMLYRETRKAFPNLTTILMTGYAADEIINQGLREGIKTVLTKPLDIDFLLVLLSAFKRTLGENA